MITQADYITAREIAEKIQRLPQEAQRAIMNMLNGAVVISEMYRDANTESQSETRPEA